MSTINLFDAYGRVADLKDQAAAIEALPDNERDALMACLAACAAAEDGENAVSDARRQVGNLMREHDAALAADNEAAIPSHAENVAAVAAANRPGYKPKPAKPRTTSAALGAAIASLAEARAVLNRADAAFRVLSARRGEAILSWMACQPKVTTFDVHREMVAAEAERKLDIIHGRVEAPPVAAPVKVSELDRVLGARGKTATNRLPTYHGSRR
jgi:hypothetical protein